MTRSRTGWLAVLALQIAVGTGVSGNRLAAQTAAEPTDPVAEFQQRLRAASDSDEATDFALALAAFLRIELGDARRPALLESGAFTALRAGDASLAVRIADEAMASGSRAPRLMATTVRALVASRQTERAFDVAHTLDKSHPGAIGGLLLETFATFAPHAASRARRGERSKALWWYRRVVEVSQRADYALSNLALTLRFLGELDESEACYREALRKSPDDVLLWSDFGLMLKAAGRTKEAIEAFHASLSRDAEPGDGPSLTNLVLLFRNDKTAAVDDPIRSTAQILERRPEAELARRLSIDLILEKARSARSR